MKLLKVVAVVAVTYVALLAVLESAIGFVQPHMAGGSGNASGIVLTTTDAQGKAIDRTLAGVTMDKHLYVAANHWTRMWYYRALAHPAVQVTININGNSKRGNYTAVPVTGAERDRIAANYNMGFVLRLMTGFAPQRFLRLDPR